MRVRIEVTGGPHTGAEFVFEDHASFVVGRDPKAQFRLSLKDRYLSRLHFFVEIKPPDCILVDLNSTNKTIVNGAKIDRVVLAHGDTIEAGETTLKVAIEAGGRPVGKPIEDNDPPEIPPYRLESRLGVGTCGAVYLASDTRDGSRVAIKVLSPVIANCPKSAAMFDREASLLRRLDHPNIVRLFEAGRIGDQLFMAMEYVPGRDALHLYEAEGGPLAIGRAVAIVRQALDALANAHAAGIVHRDVKPNNLLVARINRRDAVKVVDFGLARLYNESTLSGLTTYKSVRPGSDPLAGLIDTRGTIGFLPPEQIMDLRGVGPSADQYGAAATLYFLLTGGLAHEFPDDDLGECFRLILTEDAVSIRDHRPDLPDGLARAIDRALSRDPKDRFADAAAMRDALAPWADH